MADHSSRSCPYDQANIFSKITFWWMNALFKLGSKNHLSSHNICDVSKDDESGFVLSKLEQCWKDEVQKYSEGRNASLFRAVLKAFKWQWILPGFMVLGIESIKVVQPYLIGFFISYLNNDSDSVPSATAYGIGACLGLSAILQSSLNTTYYFTMQHIAMRMRVAIGALIYRKVLSLSSEAFQNSPPTEIVSLLSTDIEKFNSSLDLLHYFWISPLSAVIVVYLMYQQIGAACFWGLLIVVIIIPLQAGLVIVSSRLRQKMKACSEQRIQLMTEIIKFMRTVKMNCLELPFETVITKIRKSEILLLRWCGIVHIVDFMSETMTSRLALFVIVLMVRHWANIGPASVLTTLAYLCVLQSFVQRFPVRALQEIRKLHRSTQLVQAFLLHDEEKEQIKDLRLHRSISFRNEPHSEWAIDIDHMTARWPLEYLEERRKFQKKKQRSSTSSTKSLLHESDIDHAFSLKYISLQVKKGELLAVAGIVGSGKSSLLKCLIGELPYEIGQISINGCLSYCGQTNWVFNGTVKDNILFGHAFNPNHYYHVIQACGLTKDLELLPKGDQTFVGERGLQLSQGQKARLSLARCVYHDSNIFLLDDPLSFVDTNLGQHIFQSCILELLREKTVVLVSHQLQYLKQAHRIVVLRDGSVYDVGTYDELKSRGVDMRALASADKTSRHLTDASRQAEEEETKMLLERKYVDLNAESDEEEDSQTGCAWFRTCWEYFCAGFGPVLMPFLLPLLVVGPALYYLSDLMLVEWLREVLSDKSTENIAANITSPTVSSLAVNRTRMADVPSESDHMTASLKIYIILVPICSIVFIVYAAIFLQMAATAGQRLHSRMLASVINAAPQIFDTHFVEYVLQRFSRDLDVIDSVIMGLGYMVTQRTAQYVGFFLLTVIANPWLVIAVIPILVLIVLIRIYALRTLRQVKRLEGTAHSPVYSHLLDTILGLETIRALSKRDQFLQEFDEHQNIHTAAQFLYLGCYRWMTVRSLGVFVLYMNIIIFVSLGLRDSVDGNLVALSLIYCISISEPFELYMNASADLETSMSAVERVLKCSHLDQEPPKTSDKPPSPEWPNRGAISFTKMPSQKRHVVPLMLKNMECHIKGKEKIGIVGRTESCGYLITSLLRLAKPTDIIYIDGVDISKLGTHELRSKISVIPRDPVLFNQTLRWNLDPLNEFSDERLWHALEQVHLKNKVDLLPGKLYTEIQDGGTDLMSVGQKQLVYLARAILRYSRIIILEEASSNIDQETDDIIQKTVRAKFMESTVLTFAHQLQKVMDCDRIMVLEDDELKEFDTPYNLLQNSKGVFTRLVQNRGKNQAEHLQALAELSHNQRTSASIQLHRAMRLADEQLAQSNEDLHAGRASLDWNRFTHSQDSLDKALMESVLEKKAVAPSQKLISRRSPGRANKTPKEEEKLLKHDSLPKSDVRDKSVSKLASGSPNISDDSGNSQVYTSEQLDPNSKLNAAHSDSRDIGDTETTFDFSDSPVVKYQPHPSHRISPESRQVGQHSQPKEHKIHSSQVAETNSPVSSLEITGKHVETDVYLSKKNNEQFV